MITTINLPTNLYPLAAHSMGNTVSCSSSNSANDKFRYVFELEIDGVNVATIRTPPNPQAIGIFNPYRILRHQVTPDWEHSSNAGQSILFNSPVAHVFSKNRNAIRSVTVRFGESYSSGPDTEPVDYLNLANHSWKIYPGIRQLNLGFGATTHGQLLASTSEFMVDETEINSSGQVEIYVTQNDSYLLPFMVDATFSAVASFDIEMHFSDGSTALVNVPLNSTKGGTAVGSIANDRDRLQYFQCGPYNIINAFHFSAPQSPYDTVEWDYYLVWAKNGAGTQISRKYKFNKKCLNRRFTNYQLMFPNDRGGWNFQGFYMKSIKEYKAERQTYSAMIGTYEAATFDFEGVERMETDFMISSSEEMVINTNWLTTQQATSLRHYLLNRNPYLVEGVNLTPVQVVDTQYRLKTIKNDKLVQVQVRIRKSQPIIGS